MQSFWNTIQKLLYLWTAMFQNLAYRQYSICGSPTGCLPTRTISAARGFAIVHNLSQHSALRLAISSFATNSRSWRLKVSDSNIMRFRRFRYCDDQYSICGSPTGSLPTRTTTAARGFAIVHNLSQHSALLSAISSFITNSHCRRLKVSDRNTIGQRPMASIIQSLTTSLKGSDRYSLRHRRMSNTDIYSFSQSLKGSYRFSNIHQFNSEKQWLNH